MIAAEDNNSADLPKDLEGWKARAEYFESLFKIEQLTSTKLRLINRSLAVSGTGSTCFRPMVEGAKLRVAAMRRDTLGLSDARGAVNRA